jgi:hypothetical protein
MFWNNGHLRGQRVSQGSNPQGFSTRWLLGWFFSLTLKMEAVSSSEMFVHLYWDAQYNIVAAVRT